MAAVGLGQASFLCGSALSRLSVQYPPRVSRPSVCRASLGGSNGEEVKKIVGGAAVAAFLLLYSPQTGALGVAGGYDAQAAEVSSFQDEEIDWVQAALQRAEQYYGVTEENSAAKSAKAASPDPSPELRAPSPEVKAPSPEVKQIPSPEAKAKVPSPEVKSPSPEVKAPPPEVKAPVPEAKAKAPLPEVKAPEVRAPLPEIKAPAPEARAPAPEVKAPAPEAKAPAPEAKAPAPEAKAPAPEVKAPAPEVKAPAPEVKAPAPEAKAPAPEAKAPAPVAKAPAPEAKAPAPEAKAPVPEAKAPAPEAKAPAPEAKAPAPEVKAPAPEAKSSAPEPKAPSPEPKDPSSKFTAPQQSPDASAAKVKSGDRSAETSPPYLKVPPREPSATSGPKAPEAQKAPAPDAQAISKSRPSSKQELPAVENSTSAPDQENFIQKIAKDPTMAITVALVGIWALGFGALWSFLQGGTEKQEVTAEGALKALEKEGAALVDIRSKAEIARTGSPSLKSVGVIGIRVPEYEEEKDGTRRSEVADLVKAIKGAKGLEAGGPILVILDKNGETAKRVAKQLKGGAFAKVLAVEGGADAWRVSGLAWRRPNTIFTLDLALDLAPTTRGGTLTGPGQDPTVIMSTLGVAAAATASLILFSEAGNALQLLGSVAMLQVFARRLLFAKDRKKLLDQVQSYLSTSVAPPELAADIKDLSATLIPRDSIIRLSESNKVVPLHQPQRSESPPPTASLPAASATGNGAVTDTATMWPDLPPPTQNGARKIVPRTLPVRPRTPPRSRTPTRPSTPSRAPTRTRARTPPRARTPTPPRSRSPPPRSWEPEEVKTEVWNLEERKEPAQNGAFEWGGAPTAVVEEAPAAPVAEVWQSENGGEEYYFETEEEEEAYWEEERQRQLALEGISKRRRAQQANVRQQLNRRLSSQYRRPR